MTGTSTPINPFTSTPTEESLFLYLEDLLRSRLPVSWQVTVSREGLPPSLWFRPDALLTLIAPTNRVARFAMEAKRILYPKDAYGITAQMAWLATGDRRKVREQQLAEVDGLLLVAPYLAPETRQLLARGGFSYADGTGNVRIDVNDPPMFVELSGAQANPWRDERPLRSLRGAGSARVVRALLDFTPPYQLRDLAKEAGLPLATASRAVSYLTTQALVERKSPRAPIERVDWEGILRLWTNDYGMQKSNEAEFYFDPRGPLAVLSRLPQLRARYAVTGSLAAVAKAPVASPALAAIYVENLRGASTDLELRSSESGGNVVLLRPSSEAPFERTWSMDRIVYTGLSQAAADLLTAPGRGPSEAEALISWMRDNEDVWRIPGPAPR